MLIDCESCTARPVACGDCVVTHLLSLQPVPQREGEPAATAELTSSEVAAVALLSAQGLVPPLRLVTAETPSVTTRQARETTDPGSLGGDVRAG